MSAERVRVPSQLGIRSVTATVYGAAVLAGIYIGGPAWVALVLLAAVLCYRELAAIGGASSHVGGMIACGAMIGVAALGFPEAGIAIAALFLAFNLLFGARTDPPFSPAFMLSWAFTAAGLLYVGGLLMHAVLLRNLPAGRSWALIALFGVWACDTGAYMIGSMFGRHKMSPRISPNKTWEGTVGGFALGAAFVIAGSWLLDVSWPHAIALAVIVPIATVLGDLAESALKRGTGAKDTGHLLPGHGGMLDRVDSLMVVLPIVYYYVTLIAH